MGVHTCMNPADTTMDGRSATDAHPHPPTHPQHTYVLTCSRPWATQRKRKNTPGKLLLDGVEEAAGLGLRRLVDPLAEERGAGEELLLGVPRVLDHGRGLLFVLVVDGGWSVESDGSSPFVWSWGGVG